MTEHDQTGPTERATGHEADEEHIFVDDQPRPMSEKLIAALKQNTGIDLLDGPPLGYTIDLETIDLLYSPHLNGKETEPPVVKFSYQGYEIILETRHEIRIVGQSPTESEDDTN